jgi:glucarate dehydratase
VLRLDANMGWRLTTAREVLARIEPYSIANVEDPVGSFEEMARLRQHSRIPFSTHAADLRRAAQLGVPDSFVLNTTNLGGIDPTRRFVAACEALGIDFWFYSGDTGIGTASYLHLAAAEPWLSLPSQSLLRWYADDVIEGGPFVPRAGLVTVPDGPGLGVELDRAAVERCRRRFLEDGPIDQTEADAETGYYASPPAY